MPPKDLVTRTKSRTIRVRENALWSGAFKMRSAPEHLAKPFLVCGEGRSTFIRSSPPHFGLRLVRCACRSRRLRYGKRIVQNHTYSRLS